MEYQGSNDQTWVVNWWLNNDGKSYQIMMDMARTASNKLFLADEIESFVLDNTPEIGGMFDDLLGLALLSVNWIEIADDFLNRLEEQEQ